MELKEILVLLDNTGHCSSRLDLAIDLANKHGARLTGLYVTSHHFFELHQDDMHINVSRMRQEFTDKTARAAIAAQWLDVECKVLGTEVTEVVNLHAFYADLVIVGQTEPNAADHSIPADLPERVVLWAGRPVLIVPFAGLHQHAGEQAMIAWVAGRESTRAVNDALPLLKKSHQICVMEITPTHPKSKDGEKLCSHLARHGVQARARQILASDVSIGDTLLNRVSVEGSDLLVMGAYAHTRTGAPVLGAVAKHILRHMTVPVLMSH